MVLPTATIVRAYKVRVRRNSTDICGRSEQVKVKSVRGTQREAAQGYAQSSLFWRYLDRDSKSALPATVCRNVIPAETYAPTYADWFLRGGAQGKRIKIEWPQRGKIFVEIQFKTLWRGAAHRDIFGALHLNSYLLADFYKYSGCYAPISPYQPF